MKKTIVSEKLQSILNAVPEGILFCDKRCVIRVVNLEYAKFLDSTPEALLGKNLLEQNPNTRAPQIIETGNPEMWGTCSFPKLGKGNTVIVNRIPVHDNTGEIIGMLSHVVFKDPKELNELNNKILSLSKKVNFYKNSLKSILKKNYDIERLIGNSAAILNVKKRIRSYADKPHPVLLMGKTGTGKELVARALHAESPRAEGPFISINCAAIPKELFEAELFGYAPGAFSGAQKDGKAGQIELADCGTLFLDEIGDLPLHAQVKLLRVLEGKCIMRVGSVEEHKVDFRLISATNRDIESMIARGTFREDLYYRINTLSITLPSLSERVDDIMPIAHSILSRIGYAYKSFTKKAEQALESYSWPGNIRQLYNTLVHASIHSDNDIIDFCDLPGELTEKRIADEKPANLNVKMNLSEYMSDKEAEMIRYAMHKNHDNVTAAAKSLGVSRVTLYGKLKKHGIIAAADEK